ncbi:MAG: trigger factor [Gammaproteobacteria bacterium]
MGETETAAADSPPAEKNPLARTLAYTFAAGEVDSAVDARLAKMAKTAKINGFRPGRIPLHLMRQRWGGRCLGEVLAEKATARFAEESPRLPERPAARPYFSPSAAVSAEGYRVECHYEAMPDIAAPDFSAHAVRRPVLEVGENEVDEMIARLQKDAGEYISVERPARIGDSVSVDFQAFHGDELAEEGKDRKWVLDSPMLNGEISRQIIGASAGDARTVVFQHPQTHPEESLRGVEARLEVQIKIVAELKLPELNDAFFARFGIAEGGMPAFREMVGERLKSEVESRLSQSLHARAMGAFFAATPKFPLPRALVQMEAASMFRQLQHEAGQSGLPRAAAEHAPQIYAEAARRVALALILERWQQREKPEITDAEINRRLDEIASGYEDPQAFRARAQADERAMQSLRLELLERRAAEWVCQSAKAEDEKITLPQLLGAA